MDTANDRSFFWRRDGALTCWSGPARVGGFATVCHGVVTGPRSDLVVAAKRWGERGLLPLDVVRDGICELTSLGFRGNLGPALVLQLSDGSTISVVAIVDGEQDRPTDLDAHARAQLQTGRFGSVARESDGTLRDVIAEIRTWAREHLFV